MSGDDWMYLDVNDIDLDEYRETKHEIRQPMFFHTPLVDHFQTDPNEKGAFLPWPATHGIRFRPGEVSLWGGQNFAGKSALLTQALMYWMRGTKYSDIEQKALLISPEFSPTINLARIVQQVTAQVPSNITEPDVVATLAFLQNRFLIYDAVGQVDIDDLVAVMRYAREKHGTTMVVIDNLTVMKLPKGDVNQSQGELMTSLVQAARVSGLHIHLVVHTRKPAQGEPISRYNIRGSSMLSDLADNILMVERNEAKEKKLATFDLTPEEREEIKSQADTRLHVMKQRHGSAWIGVAKLYFNPYAMRWSQDQRAIMNPFEEIKELAEIGKDNAGAQQYQRY